MTSRDDFRMPAKDQLPGTLRRSPKKAQETWSKTHDAAVEQYGEGERAHRTAFASLKHSFEKVGDHWEPKDEKGPSDPQATLGGPALGSGARELRRRRHSTDTRSEELYERARELDIRGRSRMTRPSSHAQSRASRTSAGAPRARGAGRRGPASYARPVWAARGPPFGRHLPPDRPPLSTPRAPPSLNRASNRSVEAPNGTPGVPPTAGRRGLERHAIHGHRSAPHLERTAFRRSASIDARRLDKSESTILEKRKTHCYFEDHSAARRHRHLSRLLGRARGDPPPVRRLRDDHRGRVQRRPVRPPDARADPVLESFLRSRGNLRDMERELGISYPTVRARVEALVRALGFGPRDEADSPRRRGDRRRRRRERPRPPPPRRSPPARAGRPRAARPPRAQRRGGRRGHPEPGEDQDDRTAPRVSTRELPLEPGGEVVMNSRRAASGCAASSATSSPSAARDGEDVDDEIASRGRAAGCRSATPARLPDGPPPRRHRRAAPTSRSRCPRTARLTLRTVSGDVEGDRRGRESRWSTVLGRPAARRRGRLGHRRVHVRRRRRRGGGRRSGSGARPCPAT